MDMSLVLMAVLFADGVGAGQCGDCEPDQADGERERHVPPLLARGRQRPVPHL
jgi:hypothetical protein